MSPITETGNCVSLVVKHTFVELQGVGEEQTAKLVRKASRRHTDIGVLRTPPGLECIPGHTLQSSCDDDRDEEDNKAPATRRVSLVSFVSSVDSDIFIGTSSLNMSTEWSAPHPSDTDLTLPSVDTKAELPWAPCSSSGSTISACSQTPWAPCSSSDSTLSLGSQLPWTPLSSIASSYSRGSLFPAFLHDLGTSHQTRQGLAGSSLAQEFRKDDDGGELRFMPHDSVDAENRTTVMVRNIPNDLCQFDFVKQLKQRGFNGLFDFVYLPANLRESGSFGYAFVNFTSASAAVHFTRQVESLEHDDNEWRAVWSTCQGMAANVERYQNSPLMHKSVPDDCKPALYDERGIRVQFPAPTKAIPKPRIHHTKGKAVEKDSETRKMAGNGLASLHNGKHGMQSQSHPGKNIDGDLVWPSMSKMSANVTAHMMGQFGRMAHPR